MIVFNKPPVVGNELEYMKEAIYKNNKLCGDGPFTAKCSQWIENQFDTPKALMTTSCTHALEMSAILLDIQPGDEVICPSYTFVSTVNAFVLRGATIVFVDIRPDTMNIDEKLIESAVTDKTKVIVPVHYAGVSCDMDEIMRVANKYGLYVVEDAAQSVMSSYNGKALGTIGDFGCFSFHETKNYSMGEGGSLLINSDKFIERAEVIREKGTNRSRFFRGQVDKYTWIDLGSSFLPSELNVAYLFAQLEMAKEINENRMNTWNSYYDGFECISDKVERPYIPNNCTHNAHMFYLKCKDLEERTELINYLKSNNILAVFHYIPLHSCEAGVKYGRFHGDDNFTTKESERLVRLPLYYNINIQDVEFIIKKVKKFYLNK